jgi:hypothetical protein
LLKLSQCTESILQLSLLFRADESSAWYIYYRKSNIIVCISCVFASKLAFDFPYRKWRDSVSEFEIFISLYGNSMKMHSGAFSLSLTRLVCVYLIITYGCSAHAAKAKGVPGEPLRQINNALSRRIRSHAAVGVLITPIIHRTGCGACLLFAKLQKCKLYAHPRGR